MDEEDEKSEVVSEQGEVDAVGGIYLRAVEAVIKKAVVRIREVDQNLSLLNGSLVEGNLKPAED
eukprot:756127-Hanusia_phi.AAC.3